MHRGSQLSTSSQPEKSFSLGGEGGGGGGGGEGGGGGGAWQRVFLMKEIQRVTYGESVVCKVQ